MKKLQLSILPFTQILSLIHFITLQVKVGPNGEIIVDEESTIIETSASKKAKEDLLKAPLVFESANQGCHIS